MTTDERITVDPAVLAGKPIVRGTRLSVEFIIGLMAEGWSEADILANYPGLVPGDIAACRLCARRPAVGSCLARSSVARIEAKRQRSADPGRRSPHLRAPRLRHPQKSHRDRGVHPIPAQFRPHRSSRDRKRRAGSQRRNVILAGPHFGYVRQKDDLPVSGTPPLFHK